MLNSRVLANAKLNKFNLSHTHITSGDMGYLMPVGCIEVLPGDWFRIRDEYLVRFLATIAPVMHIFDVDVRWWFCPTRLVWKNWQDFITGGPDGDNASVLPYVMSPASSGFLPGSLMNRLGVPAGVPNLKVSALPVRVYDLIYNEHYRNEWLQEPLPLSLDDGEDTTTNLDLQKTLWNRDYFTQAQPSPQKGPGVSIPLGTTAPVIGNGQTFGLTADGTNVGNISQTSISGDNRAIGISAGKAGLELPQISGSFFGGTNNVYGVSTDPDTSGLIADLSSASAITINALRQGAAVQQFQEANALTGSRYAEFIPAQYGVYCPDASLQRPDYVGGMTSPMVISEVLQTSASDANSPQGNMAGHGVSAGVSSEIRFRINEFGYLMCLMSIRPKTSHFQGLPKYLQRETRYDFAIPLLAHIGPQAIKNSEIYAQGTAADNEIWGYTLQYDDYRFIPSVVTGQMVSTLNYWTAARKFDSLPNLNGTFVECTPTTDIFAVQEQENSDHLVIEVAHHISALRPLPKQGAPGMHII